MVACIAALYYFLFFNSWVGVHGYDKQFEAPKLTGTSLNDVCRCMD